MANLDLEQIPRMRSDALYQMFDLVNEMRADAVMAATSHRGCKRATTQVRVKLSQVAKLCKQARKEIKPVAKTKEG